MPPHSTIYLLRHAESLHNTTKNFSLRDPPLTPLGVSQSAALTTSFPALATTAVILASPLTRAIETALAGFGPILPPHGTATKLILDPDLQERSALPCDTGSPVPALVARFPELEGAIREGIPAEGEWFVKEGAFAEDDGAVRARAARVRGRLAELVEELEKEGGEGARKDVAVVTHGVFMKFLAEDEEVDLPKAGWKGYRVVEGGEGWKLVAV
ncbi:histidine phosphatase superfamily [Schizothecium vesticola]|uniref:Histidine phosphatase superfamily n=1 Tax=Schizothecium vesticola TaxID=314040 RepID=A0AA40F3A3_9PEZI|nr:histidine phosphatase superfamily [Schizothecium vesticola]